MWNMLFLWCKRWKDNKHENELTCSCRLFRLGSLASCSRNIGSTYRLNSGIPDQVHEKIREVDHTHCFNKWNFFFRDSFTALYNSWVTSHVTSWEGQVHVATMLASFLLAGSETSVTNYVRSQLDVTKRNYFGVFSDIWVETNNIQLPSKIGTTSGEIERLQSLQYPCPAEVTGKEVGTPCMIIMVYRTLGVLRRSILCRVGSHTCRSCKVFNFLLFEISLCAL